MHKAVLLKELIDGVFTTDKGIYIDCTGGGGGHASELLDRLSSDAQLIILDRDHDAIERLKLRFQSDSRVTVVHSSFSLFDNILDNLNINCVDGLYADFGLSNFQLLDGERGFSFMKDGPLDMRMNADDEYSAYDVVNEYAEETIANILKKYGEESLSRKIAFEIVKYRSTKKINTTNELADIIKKAVPKKFHKPGINPATKSFQAIRIYINKELEEIEMLLKKIGTRIKVGGKVGFISFHSLEDRLVKVALKYYEKDCICPPELPICGCDKERIFKLIRRKPIVPSAHEVSENPLSRSAKLRIAEKV